VCVCVRVCLCIVTDDDGNRKTKINRFSRQCFRNASQYNNSDITTAAAVSYKHDFHLVEHDTERA